MQLDVRWCALGVPSSKDALQYTLLPTACSTCESKRCITPTGRNDQGHSSLAVKPMQRYRHRKVAVGTHQIVLGPAGARAHMTVMWRSCDTTSIPAPAQKCWHALCRRLRWPQTCYPGPSPGENNVRDQDLVR
jgi:hypothetical protein